jgi:hypothetical protein
MRFSLLYLLASAALHAAIIRGTVVEHASGKPLARTQVVLAPVPGTPGPTQAARTSTYGTFEFSALPGGSYLVSASRRGFPPVHYGQKNWRAAGTPIVLAEDQSTFLTLRMPRYGGIQGTVVDENDVGMPEHEIVAYRNTRPPRLVARAQTDDRGIFRIAGLEPGRYLVRTAGRQYEDGGYLPTFARETARVDDAAFFEVDLDRDSLEAKVRPFPGRLYNIGGRVFCTSLPPVTVTLVSDIGRETVTVNTCQGGEFRFPNKPPGLYEIWANTANSAEGAFVPFSLEDREWVKDVALVPNSSLFFNFKGPQGQVVDPATVTVQIRRVDLAGEAPPEKNRIANGRGQVLPGRWQFQLLPDPNHVAMDFRGCRGERPEGGRADGWNEVVVNTRTCMIAYTLSSHPVTLRGTVSNARDPIGAAPVFLEGWDPVNRKRLVEPRVVRTDVHGQYLFTGLSPGTYRLVSTFEYQSPDASDIDLMQPRTFTIEEGRDQQQDIELFVIR